MVKQNIGTNILPVNLTYTASPEQCNWIIKRNKMYK